MIGIADWLANEVETLGVEIRYNSYAEAEDVLSEKPDVGLSQPAVFLPSISRWAAINWLSAPGTCCQAKWSRRETSRSTTRSPVTARSPSDWLAGEGYDVELVSPDRQIGRELGGQTYPQYLETLYVPVPG